MFTAAERDSVHEYVLNLANGDPRVTSGAVTGSSSGHFGLGHGTGAHAPDEYYLIESTNPKVQGLDGAIASFVEFLYALA